MADGEAARGYYDVCELDGINLRRQAPGSVKWTLVNHQQERA